MKRILLVLLAIIIAALAYFGYTIMKSLEGQPASEIEARYMTTDDEFMDIAGARVRVRDQGPDGAPVIILLHGFTFSLESFDGWADELSTDYRVIRYDLLGHGLTGPDPQQRYAPEERAAFLGEVMNALDIDRAVVGGNSLGGLVAWRFAASNPQSVEKLILVDPGAYSINGVTDEPAEIPAPMKGFLLTVPEAGIEATINLVYADPAKASQERKDLLGAMMRREGNGTAFVQHLEEFTLPDPETALSSITAPTLILWGEQDQMIPVAQGRQMAEVIPDATLITYDNLGHAPQEEAPARTAADVRSFLEE